MNENPYASPQSEVQTTDGLTDQEAIRQTHLSHEASIGLLYYLVVFLGVIASIRAVSSIHHASSAEEIGYVVGALAFPIIGLIAGFGIRRLKPWSRILVGALSAFGLIAIPIGTIISAFILYLLFSKKGKMVFSPEYQEVIAATPQMKYQTSKWLWIVLLVFILLIVAGTMIGFMMRS